MKRLPEYCSIVLLALALLVTLPVQAKPRKLLNIKGAAALSVLHEGDDALCGDTTRFLGAIGFQTAYAPFYGEVLFLTQIGIEVLAGGWYPVLQLGRGWLTLGGGLYFRATREKLPQTQTQGCAGGSLNEVLESWGAGVTAEYLMYGGNLGFFVEVKQGFDWPHESWMAVGFDVSPLLYLMYAD